MVNEENLEMAKKYTKDDNHLYPQHSGVTSVDILVSLYTYPTLHMQKYIQSSELCLHLEPVRNTSISPIFY